MAASPSSGLRQSVSEVSETQLLQKLSDVVAYLDQILETPVPTPEAALALVMANPRTAAVLHKVGERERKIEALLLAFPASQTAQQGSRHSQ